MLPQPLVEEIRRAAAELPASLIAPLVEAIEESPNGSWSVITRRVQSVGGHPYVRGRLGALVKQWRTIAPDVPPAIIAASLRVAAHCVSTARKEQTIELVWTGPQSDTPLRRTDQVLKGIIQD